MTDTASEPTSYRVVRVLIEDCAFSEGGSLFEYQRRDNRLVLQDLSLRTVTLDSSSALF